MPGRPQVERYRAESKRLVPTLRERLDSQASTRSAHQVPTVRGNIQRVGAKAKKGQGQDALRKRSHGRKDRDRARLGMVGGSRLMDDYELTNFLYARRGCD
jgi:hypothetical protein